MSFYKFQGFNNLVSNFTGGADPSKSDDDNSDDDKKRKLVKIVKDNIERNESSKKLDLN